MAEDQENISLLPLQHDQSINTVEVHRFPGHHRRGTRRRRVLEEHLEATFKQFINDLGLTPEVIESRGINSKILEHLWRVEHSKWGFFRWVTLDFLLERLLHYLILSEHDLNASVKVGRCSGKRIGLISRGLPLRQQSALRISYFTTGFREGTELILYEGTHLGLLGILGYQLVQGIRFGRINTFLEFIKAYFDGEENAIIGTLGSLQSIDTRIITSFAIAFPMLIGGLPYGILASRQAKPLDEKKQELNVYFETNLPKSNFWWHEYLRAILPLHPTGKRIKQIEDWLCWDGRLTHQERQTLFGYLKKILNQDSLFYSKICVFSTLRNLVHSFSSNHWKLIRNHMDSELFYGMIEMKAEALALLRGGYRLKVLDHTPKDSEVCHQVIYLYSPVTHSLECTAINSLGMRETIVLNEGNLGPYFNLILSKVRDIPFERLSEEEESGLFYYLAHHDYNDALPGIHGWVFNYYLHYLRWTLADSESLKKSIVILTVKLIKMSFSALVFKVYWIAFAHYLSCPKHPGVSLDGEKLDWSADFSEKCLDTYVDFFNLLPGQPPKTLINVLNHFQVKKYDLDLSNKNLNGTVISEILRGFSENKIQIISLNLTRNSINTKEDMQALFSQIPETIETLDLTENNLADHVAGRVYQSSDAYVELFNNFNKLISLRKLILSNNPISLDFGSVAVDAFM